MLTKYLKSSKGKYFRYLSALVILLILNPCSLCYTLRNYPIFNHLYLFAVGGYYRDKAEGLIPRYDQLNDELMQSIPLPSNAVLLPDAQRRTGTGYRGHLEPPGPGGVRSLMICYATNENDIGRFYEVALSNADWKLVHTNLGEVYVKDNACIRIKEMCHIMSSEELDSLEAKYSGYTTIYEIEAYYNLNVLLGFPGLPDGGCP